jgi:hypothetical protein
VEPGVKKRGAVGVLLCGPNVTSAGSRSSSFEPVKVLCTVRVSVKGLRAPADEDVNLGWSTSEED